MMANDLIIDQERDNSSSNLQTYEPIKHISNPQEESFGDEEPNMVGAQSKSDLQKRDGSEGIHGSSDFKLDNSQQQASSSLIQLPATNQARKPYSRGKDRKSRKESVASNTGPDGKKNGRWSMMEHVRFLEALKNYGKNWKKVEDYVATRTSTQARSHAQKFFANIIKSSMTMEEFLEKISYDAINQLRRIAQKSSDKIKNGGGDEDEMSEPEILKLLMMHMSKNHHEDELEAFGDPEFKKRSTEENLSEDFEVEQNLNSESINIPDVKSRKTSFVNPNNKRKRSAKIKTQNLKRRFQRNTNKKQSANYEQMNFGAATIKAQSQIEIDQKSIFEPNHSIENRENELLTPNATTRTNRRVQKISSQFISFQNDFEGNHQFAFNSNFEELHEKIKPQSLIHEDHHHELNLSARPIVPQQSHGLAMDLNFTPQSHFNSVNPIHLPFQHLAATNNSSMIKNLNLMGDNFSRRQSRISQDLLAGPGSIHNNQHHLSNNITNLMMERSRGGSSFDINDCFTSRDHQGIDDSVNHHNGSVCKNASSSAGGFNSSLFRRPNQLHHQLPAFQS
eukprot:403358467